MQTEKLKLGEKTYDISEMKYKDVAKLSDVSKEEASKILMQTSTGITDEEYDNLTMRDGIEIMKVINKINGLEADFQVPPISK